MLYQRIAVVCLTIWMGGQLHGQSVLETDPLLATVFPLRETSANVTASQTFLLGEQVVPAGAILRVLYVRPQKSDPETRREASRQKQEAAYSRPSETVIKEEPPEVRAAVKIATTTVWETAQMFRLKLANQNTTDLRLVFQDKPDAGLQEATVGFNHGLFLGESEGKIMVLAIERRSSAFHAGFKAGDQLISLSGKPLVSGLANYVEIYRATKKAAEASSSREMKFEVQRSGEAAPLSLIIRAAPSLKFNPLGLD